MEWTPDGLSVYHRFVNAYTKSHINAHANEHAYGVCIFNYGKNFCLIQQSLEKKFNKISLLHEICGASEFVEKYRLKNETTSDVKIKEILNEIIIPCEIYMRDDKLPLLQV